MAGRSGLPSASAGSWHGPIPDVHTPTIGPSALASNSSTIVVKSCHHTSSASCSKKPGCGFEVRCSSASEATISPFGRTRTPFELPVPKSTPISSPLSATFAPAHSGPAHPALLIRPCSSGTVREDGDLDALAAGDGGDRLDGLVEGV